MPAAAIVTTVAGYLAFAVAETTNAGAQGMGLDQAFLIYPLVLTVVGLIVVTLPASWMVPARWPPLWRAMLLAIIGAAAGGFLIDVVFGPAIRFQWVGACYGGFASLVWALGTSRSAAKPLGVKNG